MRHGSIVQDILPYLYRIESDISGFLGDFGYSFSPILVSGSVGDPGIYNLPTTIPERPCGTC